MTAVLSSCACKEMETNMANLAKIRVGMDGLVTRDECTPIAFDDYGKVIGWGPAFNTGVYDTSRIR